MDWFIKLLDKLPPLRKKKRPNLAAFITFTTGGAGLAIYCGSFVEFPVLFIGLLILTKYFAVEPIDAITLLLFQSSAASIYAYWRVLESNRRLEEAAASQPARLANPTTANGVGPSQPSSRPASPNPPASAPLDAEQFWRSSGPTPGPPSSRRLPAPSSWWTTDNGPQAGAVPQASEPPWWEDAQLAPPAEGKGNTS